MPKPVVPLTDMQLQKAKPAAKQKSLFDGGGLFLLVKPCGSKLWNFKNRHLGKLKLMSFGIYPEISLDEARCALKPGNFWRKTPTRENSGAATVR